MANDKTEKATPKKREDARRKGNVARSQDLNGAVDPDGRAMVLAHGRADDVEPCRTAMRRSLTLLADRGSSPRRASAAVAEQSRAGRGRRPAARLRLHGRRRLVSVVQVGFKPDAGVMKPDFKKLNPMSGFKNLFGPRAAFETGKNVIKVVVVAAIAAVAVLPQVEEIGGLVGMPAAALAPALAREVMRVVQWAAGAYLLLAFVDLFYQRHRHEKGLRMDLQEVKDEYKQQSTPQEVRTALRRRQREAAGRRMMDAVPTADVVVTNPTHYAVALRYEPPRARPRSSPRAWTTWRRDPRGARAARRPDRPQPAARALPARDGRGRPADPRRALPGRRARAGLRLPHGWRAAAWTRSEEASRSRATCSPPARSCWSS